MPCTCSDISILVLLTLCINCPSTTFLYGYHKDSIKSSHNHSVVWLVVHMYTLVLIDKFKHYKDMQ